MNIIGAVIAKILLLLIGVPIATIVVALALAVVIAAEVVAAIGFILFLTISILATSNR